MKKRAFILALMLLLAGCGQGEMEEPPEEGPPALTLPEGAVITSAVLDGEALSPDGRFIAVARGRGEPVPEDGVYPARVSPANTVQITDTETGEALWETDGAYEQSILWSPEGGFAALARTARTWCSITIIETENWTEWEFKLPDGSAIPEYTFLPDDEPWGVWQSEGSLDLTIGRGGDAGEKTYYTCAVDVRNGKIEGIVWEENREALPGSYDFDHDGEPETVELVTVYGDEEQNKTGWYELRVRTADHRLYWSRSLHESHPGWGSYFACRLDGEDYLLRYEPVMYQGFATYSYELFSLDGAGEEELIRRGSVNFDLNFGAPMHEGYDPEVIAAFLEEVHGLLEDSELLLTTEGGNFRSGGPGSDFRDDLEFWTSEEIYDNNKSLEENIRAIGAYWQEMRAE